MSPPWGPLQGLGRVYFYTPQNLNYAAPVPLYNIGASMIFLHTEELKLLFDEHDSDDSTLL